MLILGTHPESQHPSGVQGRFSNVEGSKDEMRAWQKNKEPIGFSRQPVHAFRTHCKTVFNLVKFFSALCLCELKKTSSCTTKRRNDQEQRREREA